MTRFGFGSVFMVVLILGLTVVLMACAPAAPAPAPPTPAPKPAAEVAAPAPPTTAPKPAAPVATQAAPTPVVPAKLEKVKLAVVRKGGAFAPFYFARDKGFYQAEGLDVEIVEVAPVLHVAGVINGEIDYTPIGLAGEFYAPIIAKGVPARLFMGTHVMSTEYLVGGPGVTTLNDLKGRAIGVSSLGGSTEQSVLMALKASGLDPGTHVTFVQLPPRDRFPALASGAVAATGVGSPEHVEAQQRYGYKIVYDLGALVLRPRNALGTSERKLKENPKEVKGMIRGTLRGFRSYRDNPQESLQYLTKEFSYSPEVANVLYNDHKGELSFDGIITDETVQGVFDWAVAAGSIPAELVGKVRPQEGIDMTLLQEVLKEGK